VRLGPPGVGGDTGCDRSHPASVFLSMVNEQTVYFSILAIAIITNTWQNNVSKEKYLELFPDINTFDHLKGNL